MWALQVTVASPFRLEGRDLLSTHNWGIHDQINKTFFYSLYVSGTVTSVHTDKETDNNNQSLCTFKLKKEKVKDCSWNKTWNTEGKRGNLWELTPECLVFKILTATGYVWAIVSPSKCYLSGTTSSSPTNLHAHTHTHTTAFTLLSHANFCWIVRMIYS